MRGGSESARRWIVLVGLALLIALPLACIVPSLLTRSKRTVTPTQTQQPTTQPTAAVVPLTPRPTSVTARISEENINQWLRGQQTSLGEGMDCRDMRLAIRRDGITLSANVRLAQLQGASVPVDVRFRPAMRGERLRMEVLDVQLGGPYAMANSLVKPMLMSSLSEGLEAERFFAERGLRVTNIELGDGFMVVTAEPIP